MFKRIIQNEGYATYRGVTEDGVIVMFHLHEGYTPWIMDNKIQVWDKQRQLDGEWISVPEPLKHALKDIHVLSRYGAFPAGITCTLDRDSLYNF